MSGDEMPPDQLRPESLVVAAGRPSPGPDTPLNAPIVLAAPFRHSSEANRYSRIDSTDTVRAFEDVIGSLEGGVAVAFASGMGAIAAVVEGQPAAAIAVVPDSAYSGSIALFDEQQRLGRMTLRPVDIADTAAVLAALPGAGMLWLETLTNPLMAVPDLAALIAGARREGVMVCVDSTFTTPLLVRPLALGADLVVHSATKFLSGHSDVVMGVLVAATQEKAQFLRSRRTLTGAVPGALEAFLATRGIRTLAVRMQRAQASALVLAQRLQDHPAVRRVRFAGLAGDEGHERAAQQYDGFGAMLAFETAGTAHDAERVCESVRLITHATSLGGVETLIERRARHAIDAAHGATPTLLRLSVGIEHVEDLWADLSHALAGLSGH